MKYRIVSFACGALFIIKSPMTAVIDFKQLLVLLSIVVCARGGLKGEKSRFAESIFTPLYALLAWMVISTAFGAMNRGIHGWTALSDIKDFAFFVATGVVYHKTRSGFSLRGFTYGLAAGALIEMLLRSTAIYGVLFNLSFNEVRPMAGFPSPNTYGAVTALGCILAAGWFVQEKKVSLLAACIALGVAMLSSASRGAMLSCAVGLLTLLLLNMRTMRHQVLMAVVAMAVLLPVYKQLSDPDSFISRRVETRRLSEHIEGRQYLAELAIDLFREAPLHGAGSGSFHVKTMDAGQHVTASPHNEYVKFLGENGLIGLLLFMWFVVCLFIRAFRAADFTALLPVVSTFCALDLFFSYLVRPDVGLVIGVIVGVLSTEKIRLATTKEPAKIDVRGVPLDSEREGDAVEYPRSSSSAVRRRSQCE